MFYALILAIPDLIIWGIIIPLLLLNVLMKNVKTLSNFTLKAKFGFIYNGYK